MKENNFDLEFRKLTTSMVEIACEFVDFNTKIIDTVFIMGSIENEIINYKFFYSVDGVLLRAQSLNQNQEITFDVSDIRLLSIQRLGNDCLQKLNSLFCSHKKDVPTLFKIIYYPKSQKFDCKLSYDLQYLNFATKSFHDVFVSWFEEEKEISG